MNIDDEKLIEQYEKMFGIKSNKPKKGKKSKKKDDEESWETIEEDDS